MNPESMYATYLPISASDYHSLQSLLREADPLVTCNYKDKGNYDLVNYIVAGDLENINFRATFDRNLLSPLSKLAMGQSLAASEESVKTARIACACLAFCIYAKIVIEPSLALYEFASTQGNLAAQEDLFLFRVIDNIDPASLVDVALGRSNKLPEFVLAAARSSLAGSPTISREPKFNKRLWKWHLNYFYVLKMAFLRRSSETALESALAFQRWQYEEAFYNAAASLYCLSAISHNPPKGQMLKGIQSDNRLKLKMGLKNAAWDIFLIQESVTLSKSLKATSLGLWSLDKAVRDIARLLYISDEDSASDEVKSFYQSFWGDDATALYNSYQLNTQKANIGSNSRHLAIQASFTRVNDDIADLEFNLGFTQI
jgi:hypothetical protein